MGKSRRVKEVFILFADLEITYEGDERKEQQQHGIFEYAGNSDPPAVVYDISDQNAHRNRLKNIFVPAVGRPDHPSEKREPERQQEG